MSATPPLKGLTPEEAAARLRTAGPNRLAKENPGAALRDLLHTLADPMALMLGAAAAVYFLIGEPRDGMILLLALVPVLGIDVFLEARSRGALKKLAAAVAPRASVVRGGETVEVPAESLVPGDLLVIREGDVLHADGVVRDATHLAVDESALTGEAEPVEKTPGAPFFAGSLVRAGHGFGEIGVTGANTRFGRIASLVDEAPLERSPLQRKIHRLVKGLALLAGLAAILLLALGLARGKSVEQALLPALSLGMSAAPEEFLLVFTVFLSLGAWRLAGRGVLVRRLVSIEALGATTVICTDKTGTLTAGRFALETHLPLAGDIGEQDLLEAAVLACELRPLDTLEQDIVAHAGEHGLDVASLRETWRLVHDYDFDPVGKHMSHVWEGTGGRRRIVAKGALEGILEHCVLTSGEREEAEAANARLASEGVRVLAVAGRSGDFTGDREADERGLRLSGLLGFRDPLRPEVPGAMAECQGAGISVKLITGDHALTAHAIATAAGIAHEDDWILTGEELDRLPEAEWPRVVQRSNIFARIRPEQKYAIVDALSRAGETVAMTGDGINDAPAIRRASIGIAMGRRGTEVARAAADLVLLEDDFTSIVATVREGRHILENIQRAYLYLLPVKVTVLGLAFVGPVLGLPLLLLPVHLVWLELIVHPVAALVFEAEPAPPDVMRRPPTPLSAPLLSGPLVTSSVLSGALVAAAALGAYAWRLEGGETHARSLALAILMLGNLLLVWAARAGDRPWAALALPRTVRFWAIWGISALSLPVLLQVPAAARALRVAPLPVRDWLLAAALAAASVLWRAFGRPGKARSEQSPA